MYDVYVGIIVIYISQSYTIILTDWLCSLKSKSLQNRSVLEKNVVCVDCMLRCCCFWKGNIVNTITISDHMGCNYINNVMHDLTCCNPTDGPYTIRP